MSVLRGLLFSPILILGVGCASREPATDLSALGDKAEMYARCEATYQAMISVDKSSPDNVADVRRLAIGLKESSPTVYGIMTRAVKATISKRGRGLVDPLQESTETLLALREAAVVVLHNDVCADFVDEFLRDELFGSVHPTPSSELAQIYARYRERMDFRTMALLVLIREVQVLER